MKTISSEIMSLPGDVGDFLCFDENCNFYYEKPKKQLKVPKSKKILDRNKITLNGNFLKMDFRENIT